MSRNYRNWNVRLTRSANTGVKHCSLSPGSIVFACFIICLTAEGVRGRWKVRIIYQLSFLLPFSIQLKFNFQQRFSSVVFG